MLHSITFRPRNPFADMTTPTPDLGHPPHATGVASGLTWRVGTWLWLPLLWVLLAWAGPVARAQTAVGATHEGVLALGGSAQLALPEGRWRVAATGKTASPQPGGPEWQVLVLENQSANAFIPLLVVRHVAEPTRFGPTTCQTQASVRNVFIKDEYGTLPNQLTNHCGRALALGRLNLWRDGPAQQNPWWREAAQWLPLNERSYPVGALLLEMSVQRHNARGLRVEAFALPPAGKSSSEFLDAVQGAQGQAWKRQVATWMAHYTSQMEATFLDQRPPGLAKLAAPYDIQPAEAVAVAAVPVATPAAVPAAVSPPPARPDPTPPASGNRKALVIGNDSYSDVAPLINARADALAVGQALRSVGFQVATHLNLNEKAFKQALRDFRQQLQGGDEVVFFYAGHGVQLGNTNFLLPVDIRGDNEEQVRDDSIQLQRVLDDMHERKVRFTLAVIDACRDNPFRTQTRALGGRGLAPTQAATGQMIIYSAGSGQQALDRLGAQDPEKNGLFTRVLLREMLTPQLPVDRVLRNVRNEVVRLARTVGHEQTPALYDQAIGDFYFKP